MAVQNYTNHTRYYPPFHFVATPLLLVLLVLTIINLVRADREHLLQAVILLLGCILLIITHLHARMFALKAQDRAIRAEEALRYFVLTGQRFPAQLRLRQIIALRFASDEEFPALVQRAWQEKLGNKAIKQAIQSWRTDYSRV
ncbi:MAG TPA: DUF6526 family protein [Chitinophagaceae bacterium]|nr:DUF6526 family protein [Chitinophagaceae bacterium]